ncbi:MAG TPA: ceramidase domain-containing protein [Methyloceanibacter sp.]
MTFSEHVFRYCERGASDALLAEPINVISNLAFLFAALIGLQLLLWRPREERSADHYLLVFLVLAIGLGSLAFHLFATEGTALLDVIPIGLLMLVYLGFALNRFLGVPVGLAVLLVIGFTAIMAMTGQVQCWDGGVGVPGPEVQGAKPCLNGSVFYLPALMALIVVGLLAEERRHRAAPYLLWAAAILAVSITLRSLDFALCGRILMQGRKVGTHFAWHLLNGLALFLLLRASLEGAPDRLRAPRRVSAAEETAAPEAVAEPPEAGELRPFTAIEMTLAKGLVPPGKPKKLAERVASASKEAAKEGDAAKEAEPVKTGTEPEVLSSA